MEYQIEKLESCTECGVKYEDVDRDVYRLLVNNMYHKTIVICEKHLNDYGFVKEDGEIFES